MQRVRVVERVVDPYAYDVGYQYRASQRARDDSIAELAALKLLRTQYQLELQQLRSGVQSPPRNAPPAALQPGKQDTSDLPLEQLHASVTATVTKSCLRCHDGKNENVVNLSDLSALSPLQTWEVFAQVYLGHMPKNGTKLSDQQAETFMKYAIAATRK